MLPGFDETDDETSSLSTPSPRAFSKSDRPEIAGLFQSLDSLINGR